MVTHPASTLVQDRESSAAETSVLTTMLCRQQPVMSTNTHTATELESTLFRISREDMLQHIDCQIARHQQPFVSLLVNLPPGYT